MEIKTFKVKWAGDQKPGKRVYIPHGAYKIFAKLFKEMDDDKETAIVLLVDNECRLLGYKVVGVGGQDGVAIDPKVLLRAIVLTETEGIVLAHNHTSGRCSPSDEDKRMTRKIKYLCRTLGVEYLDHIIMGKKEYYSFFLGRKKGGEK